MTTTITTTTENFDKKSFLWLLHKAAKHNLLPEQTISTFFTIIVITIIYNIYLIWNQVCLLSCWNESSLSYDFFFILVYPKLTPFTVLKQRYKKISIWLIKKCVSFRWLTHFSLTNENMGNWIIQYIVQNILFMSVDIPQSVKTFTLIIPTYSVQAFFE